MPFASNRIAGGWYGAFAGGCPCAMAVSARQDDDAHRQSSQELAVHRPVLQARERAKWGDGY